MKAFFVAFLALAVSASALPQEYEVENWEQRNAIERQIEQLIRDISNFLRENNLDPLRVPRWAIETSPQPGIDMRLQIQNLEFTGASWIDIRRLDWSTVRTRLQLTVALPRITFSLGESSFEINFHGQKYVSEFSGEFVMSELVVGMDMNIQVGIISGISVRSVDATLRIGNMQCDANMVINKNDYSPQINNFINVRFPKFLVDNQRQIDAGLGQLIMEVANRVLG